MSSKITRLLPKIEYIYTRPKTSAGSDIFIRVELPHGFYDVDLNFRLTDELAEASRSLIIVYKKNL